MLPVSRSTLLLVLLVVIPVHAQESLEGLAALLRCPLVMPDGGVVLEPWTCIGPFKDEVFGDSLRSFRFVFDPERDVLACGGQRAALDHSYEALLFPGMMPDQRQRPWVPHPKWIDGYRHLLPRGPAPSRNETVYLYRTIRVRQALAPMMRIYAEDFIGVWLNGRPVGEGIRNYGPSHTPVPLVRALPLEVGENRLLVKITCMWGRHGFAFALDGVTVGNPLSPMAWSPAIRKDGGSNLFPGNEPFAGGGDGAPSGPPSRVAMVQDLAASLSVDAHVVERALGDDAGLPAGAAALANAVRLLRAFRPQVAMTAMYDPPASTMVSLLEALPPSVGAKAWQDARAAVAVQVREALQAFDRGDRQGIDAVLAAAAAVDATWKRAIRAIGPIVFLRCPAFGVNAIAPYNAKGAEPASICVFDPARPDQPPRVVFHEPGTVIYNLNLGFDAKTVFFAARRKGVVGGYHIYAIGIDGGNLTQITSGNGIDISPVELPDGRIMFISDRADTWVQCQAQKAGLLYSCNRDGSVVRKLSANVDSDHTPQVMDDGRVLFTRWDYGIEKNVFARHALWTMNPDGTAFRLFAGNTKEDPAGFWKARQVPGRPEVVCVFGPHHSFQAGMIGLVWNRMGPEAPRGEGFRFVTDEIPAYGDTTFPYGWQDPSPLNEKQFLVSYGGDGGKKNRLYLLDECGNRRCIYEAEGNLGCWYPLQLKERPLPPVIPSQCQNPEWTWREPEEMNRAPDGLSATLMVQNVHLGLAPQVKQGEVRWIQVMEQVQKSRCMAGGEAWGHTPIIGRGTVHVRRLVGLVPVEEDGSAHFTVPALRSISLNALDADGKLLMRMGSDMMVMPGERQSCIGCHESRQGAVAPPAHGPASSIAARKPPVAPQQPDWGTGGVIDYQKVVQPVWDRHCITCHGSQQQAGGIDLSGDRTRFFCVSYDHLVERGLVQFHQPFAGDHDENTPRTLGSVVSRLCEFIDTPKHYGVKVPFEDRQRVYTWIDANIPYYGSYAFNKCRGIGARDSWEEDQRKDETAGGWCKAGVKRIFDRRCMSCHQREIHNQGFWGFGGGPMTRLVTVSSRLWTDAGASAHMFTARYGMSALIGPELRINLTRPANSLMLMAPLAKSAGGLALCLAKDGAPVFKDRDDVDYRAMLEAIEVGKFRLYDEPREDLSEAEIAEGRRTMLSHEAVDGIMKRIRSAGSASTTK